MKDMKSKIREWLADERGATNMVSDIIKLLVVILGIMLVFSGQIIDFVKGVLEQLP